MLKWKFLIYFLWSNHFIINGSYEMMDQRATERGERKSKEEIFSKREKWEDQTQERTEKTRLED